MSDLLSSAPNSRKNRPPKLTRITILGQDPITYDIDLHHDSNWMMSRSILKHEDNDKWFTALFGPQLVPDTQQIKAEGEASTNVTASTAATAHHYEGQLHYFSDKPVDTVLACIRPVWNDVLSDWEYIQSKIGPSASTSGNVDRDVFFHCDTFLMKGRTPLHRDPIKREFFMSRKLASGEESSQPIEDVKIPPTEM